MKAVPRLQGMRDTSQDSWLRQKASQERLMEAIGSCGYHILDTPILEPTELFLRKSGGELASRMYNFTDAGSNAVSLRPEFTSSIMRYYVEHSAQLPTPMRWQYAGPVFRYGAGGEGRGQFTQVGAELIGADSALADAEILSLASTIPATLGLRGCQIELGNLDILNSLLDAVGLSERAKSFIIGSVAQLRSDHSTAAVLKRAAQLHLVNNGVEENYLGLAIADLDEAQARRVLQGILQWTATNQLGQRSPDEVVDRLLRKLKGADDRAQLETALEFTMRLAEIRGAPAASIQSAQELLKDAGAATGSLDRLSELLELLETAPGMSCNLGLDLGLVRGLAYYNGIIFEVSHPDWAGALGGGGRYDGLARALGSAASVPALGFAYTLETLLDLADSSKGKSEGESVATRTILVLPESAECNRLALQVADELRQQGHVTELAVDQMSRAEALDYAARVASQKQIVQVVVVGRQGQRAIYDIE